MNLPTGYTTELAVDGGWYEKRMWGEDQESRANCSRARSEPPVLRENSIRTERTRLLEVGHSDFSPGSLFADGFEDGSTDDWSVVEP